MDENAPEDKQAKELSINEPKNFRKVKFLQIQGLLNKRFNYETMQFKSSFSLSLVFYLALISKILFGLRQIVSCFFPRTSPIQLLIGKYSLSTKKLNVNYVMITKNSILRKYSQLFA